MIETRPPAPDQPDPTTVIRPAGPGDAALLLRMIRELAEYERLAGEVTGTEESLGRTLFGDRPAAEALVAEQAGAAAGFALYFPTYSTFLCSPGIWLEDLFVRPEHRGRGVGRALLARVAATAVARGCGRLEWAVLDWNHAAIGFYRAIGARPLDDWTTQRLDGEALRTMSLATGAEVGRLDPAPS